MWMDLLSFALKTTMIVLSFGAITIFLISMFRRNKYLEDEGTLHIRRINDHYQNMWQGLKSLALNKKQLKKAKREEKQRKEKEQAKEKPQRDHVYVMEFEGDIAATQVAALREQISALVKVAGKNDEVVVKLNSSGGMVHQYGLAASQLMRIKDKGISLTVCVDKIAASGGYMMACVADKVVAAPFAVVGSIGVVAMIPNLNRLLEKNDIDFLEMTAGEYKRTLSTFGKVTDKGRTKFQEELEDTHLLFKDFIKKNRPSLDIEAVSTGEHWYGIRAKELGLIDEIGTSDDYLVERIDNHDIFKLEYELNTTMKDKVTRALSEATIGFVTRIWEKLYDAKLFK